MIKLAKDAIYTKRLALKTLGLDDKDSMAELLMNKEIAKTFMVPSLANKGQYLELAERIINSGLNHEHLEYGIRLNGELIGFINDCGYDDEGIELGYALDPAYWNKGYMSEALNAMIIELFAAGFKKIAAGYFTENQASKRVMEHCGMVEIAGTEIIEYQGSKHQCLFMGIKRKD